MTGEQTNDERAEWLVWSVKHRTWWAANGHGYTPDVWDAGRYTKAAADEAATRGGCPRSGQVPDAVVVPAPETIRAEFTPEQIRAVPALMRELVTSAVSTTMRAVAEVAAEAARAAPDRPCVGDVVRVPRGADAVCTTAYGIRVETISDYGLSGPKLRKDGTPFRSRSVDNEGGYITRTVPWEIIPQCDVVRAEPVNA